MLKTFVRHTEGGIAIIAAVTLSLFVISISVALNISRAYYTQAQMTIAADTASIAGIISYTKNKNVNKAKRDSIKYYTTNMNNPELKITTANVKIDTVKNTATVSKTKNLPLYLRKEEMMRVNALSVATAGSVASGALAPLEVALVLDVSRSMEDKGKMEAMRSASKTLVNDILQKNLKAHISIIPFAYTVRLNSKKPYNNWLNPDLYNRYNIAASRGAPNVDSSWQGCLTNNLPPADTDDYSVTERKLVPYNIYADRVDLEYNYTTPGSMASYTPKQRKNNSNIHLVGNEREGGDDNPTGTFIYWYPAWNCDLPPVMPLTNDKARLIAHINTIRDAGYGDAPAGLSGTIGSFGVLWGWRTISEKWQNEWLESSTGLPAKYRQGTKKALIFLTDGLGEMPGRSQRVYGYGAYGYPEPTELSSLSPNEKFYGWGMYGFPKTFTPAQVANNEHYAAANAELDKRLEKVCANIMAKTDITLYSIGFDVVAGGIGAARAKAVLEKCASKPENYYMTPSNEQLKKIFKEIGESLLTSNDSVRLIK